ncbi:Fc.00g090330.m01.CDS01 [Cosmosporella sp. VM-42]
MNANNSSSHFCALTADEAFGPIVSDDCRHGFDFTLTFEQSILVILPASLLVLAAPVRLFQLRNAPVKVAGQRLRFAKLAAIALLAVLQLTLMVLWATTRLSGALLNRVSIAAACVSFASSLMSCVLSYTEHAKSTRPSTLLNAFFLVSLILDMAMVRTLWLSSIQMSIQAVFTASFSAKAALVVLEGWDKSRYLIGAGRVYSPEETAGLYGRAVFSWVTPLMKMGFRRLLNPADLFTLDEGMAAAGLNERFWHYWNKAPSGRKYHLIRCCISTLRWSLIAVIIPRLILLTFTICQPLVLNRFLIFLDDEFQSISIGYGLIAAYGLVYFGIAVSQALYWHRNGRSITMLRGALVAAIFSKATEMSITKSDDSAAVTLMSSDVEVIVRAIKQIHEFWANIIQIAIATWLLSIQIGYAASGPIIVSVIALVGTLSISPLAMKYQIAWLGKTQKRVGITSAMLGHIKSIKMSGLSQKLSTTIAALRVDEIKASHPFRVVASIIASIAQVPPLLSPVAAFALFQAVAAKTGQVLDATTLFAALSLTIMLAQPLFWIFEVMLDMSAAFGAFDRIEKFLVSDSREEYRELPRLPPSSSPLGVAGDIELQSLGNKASSVSTELTTPDAAIEVYGANFAWSEERTVLHDMNFVVPSGKLVLLLGPVASGKSTLLKGLLGEVPHTSGRISLATERLSWCDQSPWLLNQTIRDNVIGYSHFDPNLYREVIKVCDLEKDLQQLSLGDMTVVGSKGLALSGGQKQRVALARAVYARPQIALFDDVFSGLDNHTAQRVFRNLFSPQGLLRQRKTTIVLATQSVSFLSSADLLLVLNLDGHISEQGTFDNLRKNSPYLQALLKDTTHSTSSTHEDEPEENVESVEAKSPSEDQQVEGHHDKRRQLGDSTVYRYYFGSIGTAFLVTLLVVEVIWAFLESFPTVWLKFWTDANSDDGNKQVGYYLGVYAALQTIGVLWFALLLWAPLSLFTSTDLGSITTRFSQDIRMVDQNLPMGLVVTLASFFGVIAKAALLAASSYYVAISFPFLGLLYFYLQRGYLRTSRQLRLLDLEEKAPVYTQFLESLSGLASLRAFGWCKPAIEKNYGLVDRSQKPFYLLIIVQRWLVMVLDLTTTALALLIVGFAVHLRGSVSVGLTGVSLVQLISLSETLGLLIQFWTSIETSIGAVARIKQFSEETGEENLPGENQEPPPSWPEKGEIVIDGLTASYGDVDVKALDGVNLTIKPGEKVGICGRTGSGKSSLLLALFRLLDSSSGTLTIDGIPLSSLPRETIRTRLIAITQDQFVLPGTIRQNIDPSDASTTDEISTALGLVGLWDTVEERGGLGVNFDEDMLSHGQKQLFFLARAVLRRGVGNIVLLDEATSSVDQKTEEMVRKVIETQFREHTVVSIAHRLDTIVDFDRVVVMEKGCVVEVGGPKELLGSASRFKALWDASHRSKSQILNIQ